jgi:hypothetical protein
MSSKPAILIAAALDEVQRRLAMAFEQAGSISEDHTLASLGLKDGHKIVKDYIEHGELGLAFEHLVYMIDEPSLTVSKNCFNLITQAGKSLGMQEKLWAAIEHET